MCKGGDGDDQKLPLVRTPIHSRKDKRFEPGKIHTHTHTVELVCLMSLRDIDSRGNPGTWGFRGGGEKNPSERGVTKKFKVEIDRVTKCRDAGGSVEFLPLKWGTEKTVNDTMSLRRV